MSTSEVGGVADPNLNASGLEVSQITEEEMTALRNDAISLYNLAALGNIPNFTSYNDGRKAFITSPRIKWEGYSSLDITIEPLVEGLTLRLTQRKPTEYGHLEQGHIYELRRTAEESWVHVVKGEKYRRVSENQQPQLKGYAEPFSVAHHIALAAFLEAMLHPPVEPDITLTAQTQRRGLVGRILGKVSSRRA